MLLEDKVMHDCDCCKYLKSTIQNNGDINEDITSKVRTKKFEKRSSSSLTCKRKTLRLENNFY